jgi:hypothetical protein
MQAHSQRVDPAATSHVEARTNLSAAANLAAQELSMRRPTSLGVFAALALSGAVACTGQSTYVQTDEAALGRVVVYRNGIAYYERRAATTGDTLTLRVPADKVDDFLKSLTVADAKTGEALPVAFPTRTAAQGGNIDMTVQLPDKAHRDLVLTYVTEAPAWKPSYRVLLAEDGKVKIQSWAVVDNTSGEDWQSVKVGVGSSSALSFRYDLHSIRLVHRETLRTNDTFAKAPPLGGSLIQTKSTEQVLAQLDDVDIPRPSGHPDVAGDEEMPLAMPEAASAGGFRSGGGSASYGRVAKAQAAPKRESLYRRDKMDDAKLASLAAALKGKQGEIVIEGWSLEGEKDGEDKARDRANVMRNSLIERGVAPAQLSIATKSAPAGQKAGVRIVEAKAPPPSGPDGKPQAQDPDNGMPVGESHFESNAAMTVKKGTSALVSMLQGSATGDVVYLYDGDGKNGDAKYAFRAVRFKNPTTSTLETGPVTVYATNRFVGEGLTDPIPPGTVAVVPFALDRQVVVDRNVGNGDRMSKLVKLVRGVLTCEVQHLRTTKLRVTNRLGTPAVVMLRHTVAKGWEVGKAPKLVERFGEARLYQVDLKPGETQDVVIEEHTPMQRTVDLRSPVGMDLVRAWLQTNPGDEATATAMKKIIGLYGEMAKQDEVIASLRERGDEFRTRGEELQRQIFELKLVRTAGPLMVHLQQKAKETSQKLQENTIAIVNAQEALMVAKVKFHDELAELSLAGAGKTVAQK